MDLRSQISSHFLFSLLLGITIEKLRLTCFAGPQYLQYALLPFPLKGRHLTFTVFDMRKMNRALNILKDHVAAVMDVEFSPTGEELCSASYDKTIRLWNRSKGHSRDIYHTKRMQRVFSCQWTPVSATSHTKRVYFGSRGAYMPRSELALEDLEESETDSEFPYIGLSICTFRL
jgi:WD40 repeat protein